MTNTKTNFPKIDLHLNGKYVGSSTQYRTCIEAKIAYINKTTVVFLSDKLTASFAKC
jgi:hypothetical protein